MIVPYESNDRHALKVALSQNFGRRMAEARELCGMSQVEAASLLGFKNSSGLYKIEAAYNVSYGLSHLIPLAVRVFNTSADFLLGFSPHPQRDVRQARQQQIQKILADSIASELAEIRSIAKALDEIAELTQKFEGKSKETLQALIRFEELNPEFNEMPGGARLSRLIHELRQDAKHAAGKLTAIRASLKSPTSKVQ